MRSPWKRATILALAIAIVGPNAPRLTTASPSEGDRPAVTVQTARDWATRRTACQPVPPWQEAGRHILDPGWVSDRLGRFERLLAGGLGTTGAVRAIAVTQPRRCPAGAGPDGETS